MSTSTPTKSDDELRQRVVQLWDKQNALRSNLSPQSRLLAELFYSLQAFADKNNVTLPIPSIVVIGNQNHGKSTFVDGLAGFKFNITMEGLGSRRPLLIQMLNDPKAATPIIRLREPSWPEGKYQDVKQADCEAEIKKLTDAHLATLPQGSAISNQSLIASVRYKDCANISIYDMPGFRASDLAVNQLIEQTILKFVKDDNVVICHVEECDQWVNADASKADSFIRRIDPELKRTFLLNSKLDNRLRSFTTAPQLLAYFRAEDCPEKVLQAADKHFTSMPTGQIPIDAFWREVQKVVMKDMYTMLKLGLSEDQIANTSVLYAANKLQQIMFSKIRQSFNPAIAALEEEHRKKQDYLDSIKPALESDLKLLDNYQYHMWSMTKDMIKILERQLTGSTVLASHGRKFAKCMEKSPVPLDARFKIDNADLDLIGGAAIDRCLDWFKKHILNLQLQLITEAEAALVLTKQDPEGNAKLVERGIARLLREKSKGLVKEAVAALVFLLQDEVRNTIEAINASTKSNKSFYKLVGGLLRKQITQYAVKFQKYLNIEFTKLTKYTDWWMVEQQLPSSASDADGDKKPLDTVINTVGQLEQLIFGKSTALVLQQFFQLARNKTTGKAETEEVRKAVDMLFQVVKVKFVQALNGVYGIFFRQKIESKLLDDIESAVKEIKKADVQKIINVDLDVKKQEVQALEEELDALEDLMDRINAYKASVPEPDPAKPNNNNNPVKNNNNNNGPGPGPANGTVPNQNSPNNTNPNNGPSNATPSGNNTNQNPPSTNGTGPNATPTKPNGTPTTTTA